LFAKLPDDTRAAAVTRFGVDTLAATLHPFARRDEDECVFLFHRVSADEFSSRFATFAPMACMDRFDLVMPEPGEPRERFLRSFFQAVADEYETLIDRERNADNIRTLIARVRPARCGPVLDFGNGSGLSSAIAAEVGVELVGFDVCPAMRALAAAHGATVIDDAQLSGRAPSSFGGAFASYLLHLQPEPPQLRDVFRVLAQGAVFAANFHKGAGLLEFRRHACATGFEIVPDAAFAAESVHGPRIICRKP
jgi:SAM-dependent methyltransferase